MSGLVAGPIQAPACDTRLCRCVPAAAMGLSPDAYRRAQRDRADVVVLATVLRVDTLADLRVGKDGPPDGPVVARLSVGDTWKGTHSDTISVLVHTSWRVTRSCDHAFRPGEQYLVFATIGTGGMLRTDACAGTQHARDAGATIVVLGAPARRRP